MAFRWRGGVWRVAALWVALFVGHVASAGNWAKHEAPIPAATLALMAARDTQPSSPILIRTFKKEAELEVWKQARNGRYVLLKTFPICRWSGQLGPKAREGDRQTPEGFYSVGPRQMNPNSAYYLSFDIGYPNAYDRAHGGTGSFLMVHGTCSSAGCYAMTDEAVGEIYALAREAFAGGQAAFQFQAYPFRMNAQNMAKHRSDRHIAFWRQLKVGADRFEATGEEPAVVVAGGRYTFSPSRNAAREALAKARLAEEDARVAALVAEGSAAVRTTYADGGQHPFFRARARAGVSLGTVSRPEALAFAGREVVIIPARPKRPATQLADAAAGAPAPKPAPAVAILFVATPLNAAGPPSAPVSSMIAGSRRIVPAALTSAPFEVAAVQ